MEIPAPKTYPLPSMFWLRPEGVAVGGPGAGAVELVVAPEALEGGEKVEVRVPVAGRCDGGRGVLGGGEVPS